MVRILGTDQIQGRDHGALGEAVSEVQESLGEDLPCIRGDLRGTRGSADAQHDRIVV
jgi:hypothetical protein